MAMIDFIVNTWPVWIVLAGMLAVVIYAVKTFYDLPSDEQAEKVKEWLLYMVILAEKELGSKTGQVKLRFTYDKFIEKWPKLAAVVPFETFSDWVDEALAKMKYLSETNPSIRMYINNLKFM